METKKGKGGSLSKILDTPTYYFRYPLLKILDSKDTIEINTIEKEGISDFEESQSDSFNDLSLRDDLKKKMNKNKSLKKIKNKSTLTDEDKENEKFFDYWISKELTTDHKKGTKLYVKCLKYFTELKNGSFSQNKKFDKKSLPANNIDLKALNKKWNENDIYKALDNLYLMFFEGYWPQNKDIVKKMSLDKMLFNVNTKKSWFLNAFFNPPKKIQFEQKNVHSSNEFAYNIIRGFFADLSSAQENKLIMTTNNLFKEIEQAFDRIDPWHKITSIPVHMGSKENYNRLINNLIDYHKKHNEERMIGKLSPKSKTWKNFLDEMNRVHHCLLFPTDKQLKDMERDYEAYQVRKRNRMSN
jgi:hypothetical protein